MRRVLPFLIGLMVVGCGPFTNVPAQIHVQSIVPNAVTVQFTKDDKGNVTASYKNPTITFVGEPGSVGAVFNSAVITYFDADNHKLDTPKPFSTFIHVDVGTSNYRDPDDPKKILLGTGSWDAPVVNQEVIDYGNQGKAAMSAQIDLSGKDYAWYPITRSLIIPITFAGQAN